MAIALFAATTVATTAQTAQTIEVEVTMKTVLKDTLVNYKMVDTKTGEIFQSLPTTVQMVIGEKSIASLVGGGPTGGPSFAFSHVNSRGQTYYLHSKDVQLRGSGRTQ